MDEVKALPGKGEKFDNAIRAVQKFRQKHPKRPHEFMAQRVSTIDLLVNSKEAKPAKSLVHPAPDTTPFRLAVTRG